MADLPGGGPSTSSNARPGRTQVPGGTGSPSIKGPVQIMRDRQARERRKQEEAERLEMERIHAEEEARLIEDERRRSAERRAAAVTGAAPPQRGSGESGGQRGSGGTAGQRGSGGSRVVSGERQQDQPLQGVGRGGRAVGGGEPANRRPPQPQGRAAPPAENARTRTAQAGTSAPPPADLPLSNSNAAQPRSTFPHAFERWETLSAHWEGLTSFWIRRLEENSNEINREPISQQLSRQVTDLSAAGANLFHAVVELQRLRASSERKFQRWFFETRTEQERSQEIQAMTEASLTQERIERAAAIQVAVENERQRSTTDKQFAEMKRELRIAKEEARRAWEELGKREQEERERTASLREGQPTIVGGVQVVPMMQGVPNRHGSSRAPEPAVQEPEGPVDSDIAYQQYSRAQRAEPGDPFTEQETTPTRAPRGSSRPATTQEYTQAPAVQPAASTFYQQPGTSIHPVDPTNRSEHNPSYGPSVQSSGLSEEEYQIDDQGHFVRDREGRKVPWPDDDEDDATAHARELAHLQQYGRAPISGVEYGRGPTATAGASSRLAPPTSNPSTSNASTSSGDGVDYSGQAFGSGAGWEAVPRHHHPTRLSDVLEEDERSRTSASQVSRRD